MTILREHFRCGPHRAGFRPLGRRSLRTAYTLVEILVATVLTLIMMTGVVQLFATVGKSVNNARTNMEVQNQLRLAANRLIRDLDCTTVRMDQTPPRKPEAGEGYFEYIEGPIGPVILPKDIDKNTVDPITTGQTVGDFDDILMFTMRSRERPFIGRWSGSPDGTIESRQAEVAWFVRGRTLYRRLLLVAPQLNNPMTGRLALSSYGFYANNDISVRQERDPSGSLRFVANSLGDLTKRENRFAHGTAKPLPQTDFPFDARRWGQLGLPTLRECCYTDTSTPTKSWNAGGVAPLAPTAWTNGIDLWTPGAPVSTDLGTSLWKTNEVEPNTLTMNASPNYVYYDANPLRVAEDVVLNNVIGFDVKAWDPGAPVLYRKPAVDANGTQQDLVLLPGDPGYPLTPPGGAPVISYGAYVDLNYSRGTYSSAFAGPGNAQSKLNADLSAPAGQEWKRAAVYDTGSAHYDNNWQDLNGDKIQNAGDFGDDDGDGQFDEGDESTPPYAVPLRGIQIKIRVFEPDSKQVREVTIVREFLVK